MRAPSPTPFRSVLIANRGEIALRVIRTARALGHRTVAVYSTADAAARHVSEADQAVCIGEPQPAHSYLCIPALLEAARLTGAEAVHPGYGFLAENADFARACRDAGLVFIGPSPDAIRAMGNKAGAKAAMEKAGVPCIPGYQDTDQSEKRLAAEAARIGFPVMIKAAAGGGGRGMRLVRSPDAFAAELRSARSEAQSAFGDPQVILERAIVAARHIEIQIFSDRFGNAVHLGERDCSVQRRHQKLIEESPSPGVGAELRARMGAIAVAAVKAIGYEGAGTLEFLLDRDGAFYFMEMNTRLQVEHPVTEALTGLDLVEWQLRVAAGEALPLRQDQIRFEGHAIEVRLCAEDAAADFMPQSGTMALWAPPDQLRTDTALACGAQISPYYDSMVAKIVSHGRTREDARRKLVAGLEDTTALGVTTNQLFLRRCLEHPVFVRGEATTDFIAAERSALLAMDEAANARTSAVSAVLLHETSIAEHRRTRGRTLAHALPVAMRYELANRMVDARLTRTGAHGYTVSLGERSFAIALEDVDRTAATLVCDGVRERARYHRDGATLLLHYRGAALRVEDKTLAAAARQADAAGGGKLRASMNGRVVGVLVAVGDRVSAGQPIVILEAMKMEHTHTARIDGEVTALHVNAGDQVAAHRVVAEIRGTAEAREGP